MSTASDIVASLGGPGNIAGLTHCATRLRFQLNDGSVVDTAKVEAIPEVMGGVPQAGNRYQVVIGGAVQTVYNAILALPEMSAMGKGGPKSDEEIKAAARAGGVRGKFAWLDSFFEFLSDSFRPLLGALLGASLFITFMSLMSTLGVIGNWADPRTTLPPSWQFMNLLWQTVFVFLPLMVAYNASKKLDADPWVGFAVMAIVMLPGFSALTDAATDMTVAGSTVKVVEIFGLPLTIFNYSSQVFPPLLMAAVLGPLYKLLKRIIPANVQLIFVPFFAMLIMLPLTAFIIGPIGVYAGAGLSNVLKSINDLSPFIFAIVIPLAYPFMVPLGLHWPINAIMLLNIQTLGYDYIQGPMGAWNFACFGATAGVLFLSIRDKDVQMRQTATGALAAGLLGGGLKTNAFAFTSLLTIPAFRPMPLYLIAIAAAFFISMILVIVSDYRTPEQRAEALAKRQSAQDLAKSADSAPAAAATGAAASGAAAAGSPAAATKPALQADAVTTIGAPMEGEVIPLAEVPDPVFSKGVVGQGVGIVPSGDTVYAPAAGKIIVAAKTGHAFGIDCDSGIQLLIHVGIDTVSLEGRGFDVKVSAGTMVEKGAPLVTFDRAVIEEAGYSLVTPVLVTNATKFGSIEQVHSGAASVGDAVIAVHAKPAVIDLADAPAKATNQ
jgi:PTS system beta-glucosides-specific IIC component